MRKRLGASLYRHAESSFCRLRSILIIFSTVNLDSFPGALFSCFMLIQSFATSMDDSFFYVNVRLERLYLIGVIFSYRGKKERWRSR